jgi:protein-tyrosine kinase
MVVAVDRSGIVAPLAQGSARKSAAAQQVSPLDALSDALIAALDPADAENEPLRELRSQLILRWFGETRTLAVLGAHAADGAEVVAANLAIVLAQLDEPTLLIDANLRAPRQHELFGLTPHYGLVDLLLDRDVLEDAVLPAPGVDHLHVLCAGAVPPNPQELVSRAPFATLLETLSQRFRAIVVTTPPAALYADAQVIAARARGCLLVTRRHKTRVADIEHIKSQLAAGAAVLLGGVIRE